MRCKLKSKIIALPIIFGLMSGCTTVFTVGSLDPKPNVDVLGYEGKTISLDISNKIKNDFIVPQKNNCLGLDISDFKNSLNKGFEYAYDDSFSVVPQGSDSDYKIKLLSIQPYGEVTAVNGNGAAVSCAIDIKYKARLEVNGKAIMSSSETVESKTRRGFNLESAIESMYEVMSKEFFSKN